MSADGSGTRESVVRMANQIACNLEVHGQDVAIAETRDHIEQFWDPRMKQIAIALLDEPDCGLSPPARAAIRSLSIRE
ncbi:hypothetical protein AMC99_00159 [Altererythrobacter epoxidivorans]|uniref:NAD-dependent formate dehydrogenase delta subunit n=1 Tax=Altererythrobacter epoxidivorans TaxID=361183 RepID=A0A0M4MTK4_9SPHN|nr:formate dehydrogenase subunit delta [Altererythrobacter epoxidivorans]ALE15475.1 hypothetical protein AMC99_00159 [Altererythrobacter epoxidivorans]